MVKNMIRNTIIFLLIITLFVAGCAQKALTPETTEVETTGEASVDEVSSDIDEVDTIDEDLEATELDDLEQELSELDW